MPLLPCHPRLGSVAAPARHQHPQRSPCHPPRRHHFFCLITRRWVECCSFSMSQFPPEGRRRRQAPAPHPRHHPDFPHFCTPPHDHVSGLPSPVFPLRATASDAPEVQFPHRSVFPTQEPLRIVYPPSRLAGWAADLLHGRPPRPRPCDLDEGAALDAPVPTLPGRGLISHHLWTSTRRG